MMDSPKNRDLKQEVHERGQFRKREEDGHHKTHKVAKNTLRMT